MIEIVVISIYNKPSKPRALSNEEIHTFCSYFVSGYCACTRDDKPVTKVANNKYSITLLTNAIIREAGSRKPSPQDEKDHLAEITARMKQGGVCDNGFIITDMSYRPPPGGLAGLVVKNIHRIEYTIGCK